MPVTKWVRDHIVGEAIVALLGAIILLQNDALSQMGICTSGEILCGLRFGIAFIVGIFIVGMVADGFVWFGRFLYKRIVIYINSFGKGKIALDTYEEVLPSGEKRVGLVVFNKEWFHDMHRFELWINYLRSNDLPESIKILKSVNDNISRLKTSRLKWREGDTKNNGLNNIRRIKGNQKLIIAETDSKRNSITLKFSEADITDITPGVYQSAIEGKGVMKNRPVGLYAFAVEVVYVGGIDLHINLIPLNDAGFI